MVFTGNSNLMRKLRKRLWHQLKEFDGVSSLVSCSQYQFHGTFSEKTAVTLHAYLGYCVIENVVKRTMKVWKLVLINIRMCVL